MHSSLETALGCVAFTGSATHMLHVGAYPQVGVTGWMVWTVAGSLEAIAALAAWEVRRGTGWSRTVPAVVLVLAFGFIILANLAAADSYSWAAHLPWAQAFAVAPPISFVSILAIAETRNWKRPHSERPRRSLPPAGKSNRKPVLGPVDAHVTQIDQGKPQFTSSRLDNGSSLRSEPGSETPVARSGENRSEAVARWRHEGHSRKSIIEHGVLAFQVSTSTMKRELQG